VKNQGQQRFECGAVGGVWAQQGCGVFAPYGLLIGEFAGVPLMFLQDSYNIGGGEFVFWRDASCAFGATV
jgi:hypothetical protein